MEIHGLLSYSRAALRYRKFSWEYAWIFFSKLGNLDGVLSFFFMSEAAAEIFWDSLTGKYVLWSSSQKLRKFIVTAEEIFFAAWKFL